MNLRTLQRRALLGLAALASLASLSTAAQAQSYPNRPVKIVVPLAAGGGPDIETRRMATKLRATLNGNVVVEDHAYIGTGVIIKQGQPGQPLVIGRGAVVGMGAIVTKSVPPGVTVVGNPARPFFKN